MANTLLYNKYRPIKFSEVQGNKETTDILKGIIKNKEYKNTHSIFFAPPGSGKTTSARIFARAINCLNPQDGEPCNKCEHCKKFLQNEYPDYIEVDGTSYNTVDAAKRLIDIANQYPIVKNGYRVIMIDEAHRLSNQAWDKFLVLLESGDVKTIFIFATTDIHLFRPAIISRCFVFGIKPLTASDIAKELLRVCKGEGISYSMEAINKLAYHYANKPRDAVKTLDMYIRANGHFNTYEQETVESTLLQCFKLAYFNKFDEYLPILEKMPSQSLPLNLSRMLNEVFCYPAIQPVLISPRQIEEFKNLIDNANFKQIIKDVLQFKPQDTYALTLILTQVSALGDKLQQKASSQSQYKGRRFIDTPQQSMLGVEKPKGLVSSEKTQITEEIDDIVIAPELQPNLQPTNNQISIQERKLKEENNSTMSDSCSPDMSNSYRNSLPESDPKLKVNETTDSTQLNTLNLEQYGFRKVI